MLFNPARTKQTTWMLIECSLAVLSSFAIQFLLNKINLQANLFRGTKPVREMAAHSSLNLQATAIALAFDRLMDDEQQNKAPTEHKRESSSSKVQKVTTTAYWNGNCTNKRARFPFYLTLNAKVSLPSKKSSLILNANLKSNFAYSGCISFWLFLFSLFAHLNWRSPRESELSVQAASPKRATQSSAIEAHRQPNKRPGRSIDRERFASCMRKKERKREFSPIWAICRQAWAIGLVSSLIQPCNLVTEIPAELSW